MSVSDVLGSDFAPSSAGVHVSEVTGQHSANTGGGAGQQASASANVSAATAAEPASDAASTASGGAAGSGGLLSLEPPLASSDYSFSLDDQENLNDLFELF